MAHSALADYAQWPIVKKPIQRFCPKHGMILKLEYLGEFEIILKMA
jgi:hypothetical protein